MTCGLVLSLASAGCGGKSSADVAAVRIGHKSITAATVAHWISVLKGRGSNGHEPGPPTPVPPAYTACIAYAKLHPPTADENPPIPKQPKAYCEFEYRRFKLKALYLLISYQWVAGEAAELGVKPNRPQLAAQLAAFRQSLGLSSDAAFRRYLKFTRATPADLRLSFELQQLTQEIEAKLAPSSDSPAAKRLALNRFGTQYKRKWTARTDCRPAYVVPLCRQYGPKYRSEFGPPGVPLEATPSSG